MPSAEVIREALRKVPEPELGGDIVSRNLVRDIQVEGGHAVVTIALTTPACPFQLRLESEIQDAVRAMEGVQSVAVRFEVRMARPASPGPVPGVIHCVGITGARAGVGRSAVAAHLAVALAEAGARRAAAFDADPTGTGLAVVRGPGGYGEAGGLIVPAEVEGAHFVGADAFTRGDRALPLLDRLRRVAWGAVDYLLLDLPVGQAGADVVRGAGVPWTGIVIVCTPQESAAQRGLAAVEGWRAAGMTVLGIIENMS
ncbi:MAG TPA: iron-sulfur cluster assembly protein, partial [Candidatus Sulfotelmatobacter sp.]|nr:iron-sulfur cluster assembly protein [Candidatus Sulfotelmatobacter sp.]